MIQHATLLSLPARSALVALFTLVGLAGACSSDPATVTGDGAGDRKTDTGSETGALADGGTGVADGGTGPGTAGESGGGSANGDAGDVGDIGDVRPEVNVFPYEDASTDVAFASAYCQVPPARVGTNALPAAAVVTLPADGKAHKVQWIDETGIYVVTDDQVTRHPLAGGAAVPIYAHQPGEFGIASPGSTRIVGGDGERLFLHRRWGALPPPPPDHLIAVKLADRSVTVIAKGTRLREQRLTFEAEPHSVDATGIYWIGSREEGGFLRLVRTNKDGSEGKTLYELGVSGYVTQLEADAENFYLGVQRAHSDMGPYWFSLEKVGKQSGAVTNLLAAGEGRLERLSLSRGQLHLQIKSDSVPCDGVVLSLATSGAVAAAIKSPFNGRVRAMGPGFVAVHAPISGGSELWYLDGRGETARPIAAGDNLQRFDLLGAAGGAVYWIKGAQVWRTAFP